MREDTSRDYNLSMRPLISHWASKLLQNNDLDCTLKIDEELDSNPYVNALPMGNTRIQEVPNAYWIDINLTHGHVHTIIV